MFLKKLKNTKLSYKTGKLSEVDSSWLILQETVAHKRQECIDLSALTFFFRRYCCSKRHQIHRVFR